MPFDSGMFVYLGVEHLPQYPGGETALERYLQNNLSYPTEARRNKTSGTVYTSFIVNKDGSISNPEITQDIGNGCGEEAIRLIRNMPNWTAGYQNGEYKRVKYYLPITFNLPDPVYQTCSYCNGSGLIHNNVTCSSCSGYGQTNCNYCSGKGYNACNTCAGYGYLLCSTCKLKYLNKIRQ